MTTAGLLVVAAGIATIALINWWFFFASKGSAAQATQGAEGVQSIDIVVEGGYSPARIEVVAGRPVRLTFDRREKSACSEEVVIAGLQIRKFLPAFARTVVEFTPTTPGTFDFTCGMGMLHGELHVRGDR